MLQNIIALFRGLLFIYFRKIFQLQTLYPPSILVQQTHIVIPWQFNHVPTNPRDKIARLRIARKIISHSSTPVLFLYLSLLRLLSLSLSLPLSYTLDLTQRYIARAARRRGHLSARQIISDRRRPSSRAISAWKSRAAILFTANISLATGF